MKDLNIELTDVLDEILLSGEELSADELAKWTNEYPQFENEIRNFAVFQAVDRHLPEPEEMTTQPEVSARRLEMVREIVRSAVIEKNTESIESLALQAKSEGLKFPQLAQKIGVSLPLLANLEQRFVRFASIPEDIFEKIASALQVSAVAVKNYLQLPPEMTTQASFKAESKPETPEQEDFFELVERDKMLTPEQKSDLLKFKSEKVKK